MRFADLRFTRTGRGFARKKRFRMILLDTNVISEAMKPEPAPAVLNWLDAQAAETLFLSSVTMAELGFGVAALPEGRKKQALTALLDHTIQLFEDRILPFDLAASRRYGALAAQARAGRGFPTPDGFIAAIAASRNFMVATRDANPFVAAGLTVIDPWTIDP